MHNTVIIWNELHLQYHLQREDPTEWFYQQSVQRELALLSWRGFEHFSIEETLSTLLQSLFSNTTYLWNEKWNYLSNSGNHSELVLIVSTSFVLSSTFHSIGHVYLDPHCSYYRPLIVVCGKPCSGKTKIANQLAEFIQKKGFEPTIVNVESLKLDSKTAYGGEI